MDSREAFFKIVLDLILTGLFRLLFSMPLFICFTLSHSLNMLLNGHLYAMLRHTGVGENDPESFITCIENHAERIKNCSHIKAAAAYGSLSRNVYRPTSDMDIRYVPYPGNRAFFGACIFTCTERTRALFSRFPLDAYVFDLNALDRKMKSDEPPIIIHDPQGILKKKYSNFVGIAAFIDSFRQIHVEQE